MDFPTVEVRFDNINIEAGVYVGKRALPTLINYTRNVVEVSANVASMVGSKWRMGTGVPVWKMGGLSGAHRSMRGMSGVECV